MARRFREDLLNWAKGAIVADYSAEKVPKEAASRARNVAFLKGGFPSRRKGVSIITPAAQSGKNPILGIGNGLNLNWIIDDAGRWSKVSSVGVIAPIDAAVPTPFTAGTKYPIVASAKNHMFVANGTDLKKTNGTIVTAWGFAAPAVPTAVDSGVAGNPTGDYQFALTAYNSATGHESSLSAAASVTLAGKKATVSWSFPSDPQITHVRVHIFKSGLTQNFFRLVGADVTPAADSTTGGYASTTVSITVNVTDTDINNLIIKSPTTTENNPPPAGLTFIAWHGGRMFGTDGNYLFYSQVDQPESWDPAHYEVINTNDSQKIVGFADLADFQMVIWKTSSMYTLVGPNDPNSWDIQIADPAIGLSSVRAMVFVEGAVWWEAIQGLFRIQYNSLGIGKPQRMDAPNISDRLEGLNDALIGSACAAYDAVIQRMFFVVPDADSTSRNTMMLPFNTKLQVFEDTWDPMDVSALGRFVVNSIPFVVIGGYQGRVFKVWDTPYVDGVRMSDGSSVSFTLTGTVGSVGAASLTDATATFDVADDGLREVVVVAVSPAGVVQRNIITSNTGTVLTLLHNWSILPDATWKYYIGCPWFEFDTTHLSPTSVPNTEGSPFYERTFKHYLLRANSDSQAHLDIYAILDGDLTQFATHNTASVSSGGAVWDLDSWDVGKFGSSQITDIHQTLGVRGHILGLRIQCRTPGDSLVLLGLGLYGTEHGYKK
jgi:hypothetical protein